jgi:hypothetical protein
MVKALMAGTKTQTRRIVKVQPPAEGYRLSTLMSTTGDRRNMGKHQWAKLSADGFSIDHSHDVYFTCPYGYVGDRLWVRESSYQYGRNLYSEDESGEREWFFRPDIFAPRHFAADGPKPEAAEDFLWRSVPSIHMPRWASRILLEIVGVRVERLNNISEADAIAEGIEPTEDWGGNWQWYQDYLSESNQVLARESYASLWRKINGPESWAANPWVWVVEFKVIEPAPLQPTIDKTTPETH